MTPAETIMNAVPSAHTPAPVVDRKIEIGDRVAHSVYGEGVIVVVIPNAFDNTIETYVGVRLMSGDNVRVPESQVKWIASDAEPLPFGPEYDAPKIIVADGFELDTPRTEAMNRSEVRRKREAKRVPQDDPKRVVRKPVATKRPPRKSVEPQPKKRVGGLNKIGAKGVNK